MDEWDDLFTDHWVFLSGRQLLVPPPVGSGFLRALQKIHLRQLFDKRGEGDEGSRERDLNFKKWDNASKNGRLRQNYPDFFKKMDFIQAEEAGEKKKFGETAYHFLPPLGRLFICGFFWGRLDRLIMRGKRERHNT